MLDGGNDENTAVSCSGGRKDTTCFSARLMWRANGAGELYLYLPPFDDPRFAANEKLCSLPNSICDASFGISVNRGSYSFPAGQWTTIAERVKLNDFGEANGEIELFVNGESVINVSGIIIRDSSAGRIRGIQVQSFFRSESPTKLKDRGVSWRGLIIGSSTDWATLKDQDLYFANFGAAIVDRI